MKILKEVLEYINEVLTIHGDQLLSLSDLEKLHKLYIKLEELRKLGITTKNHDKKVKSYYALRKKALTEFNLELPSIYPLPSPNDLLLEMNVILEEASLNDAQKKCFFEESMDKKRSPSKKDTDKKLQFKKAMEKIFSFPVEDIDTL